MDLKTAMGKLEAAGSEQTRKTYRRHGAREPMFGVSYAVLGKLVKEIKTDHELALALWGTGNHDARVLATMIADRGRVDAALVESWGRELGGYPLLGAVAKAAGPGISAAEIDRWCADSGEWMSALGWAVLACASQRADLPDSYFEGKLGQIEREIQGRANWTRYEMNGAVIAIGTRNERLSGLATAAARRIGHVEVDFGDTECKLPDAVAYIAKVMAHRAKKAASGKGAVKKAGTGKRSAAGNGRVKAGATKGKTAGPKRAGVGGGAVKKKAAKGGAKNGAKKRAARR